MRVHLGQRKKRPDKRERSMPDHVVTERQLDSRQLLSALRAFRRGNFSVRLPDDLVGVSGEIAAVFNEVVELNAEMTREFERISRVVGKEGKIGQRGKLRGASGGWETSVNSVNALIEDMVQP